MTRRSTDTSSQKQGSNAETLIEIADILADGFKMAKAHGSSPKVLGRYQRQLNLLDKELQHSRKANAKGGM